MNARKAKAQKLSERLKEMKSGDSNSEFRVRGVRGQIDGEVVQCGQLLLKVCQINKSGGEKSRVLPSAMLPLIV